MRLLRELEGIPSLGERLNNLGRLVKQITNGTPVEHIGRTANRVGKVVAGREMLAKARFVDNLATLMAAQMASRYTLPKTFMGTLKTYIIERLKKEVLENYDRQLQESETPFTITELLEDIKRRYPILFEKGFLYLDKKTLKRHISVEMLLKEIECSKDEEAFIYRSLSGNALREFLKSLEIED